MLPVCNATVEREFSNKLQLIKTDKRNCLHDESDSSLFRVKHWLKRNGRDAHDVNLNDNLLSSVMKVKANAVISTTK